jgi:NAD dependent epimerase/dehydratase family enzyme
MRPVQRTQHLLQLTARIAETQSNMNVDFVINIAGSQIFGSRVCNCKYYNNARHDAMFSKLVWACCT